jgi:hypothetical protein
MAVTVVSFATYLTRSPWSDGDRNALKFVKAIKGKPFKYTGYVPVLGKTQVLTASNSEDSINWFGELAASEITKLRKNAQLVLVPLPNSSCTVRNKKKPRTALLAEAIASNLKNATVWDGLRWLTENTPTHQGGTRDPQKLYDNLAVTSIPPKGTLILVDDVFTKGGHLQAAVARLAEKKAECKWAMSAGRTVLDSPANPFAIVTEEIGDFVPKG